MVMQSLLSCCLIWCYLAWCCRISYYIKHLRKSSCFFSCLARRAHFQKNDRFRALFADFLAPKRGTVTIHCCAVTIPSFAVKIQSTGNLQQFGQPSQLRSEPSQWGVQPSQLYVLPSQFLPGTVKLKMPPTRYRQNSRGANMCLALFGRCKQKRHISHHGTHLKPFWKSMKLREGMCIRCAIADMR